MTEKYYLCQNDRFGMVELPELPDEDTLKAWAEVNWHLARRGETYRWEYACPVNGDGYWINKVRYYSPNGTEVGSVDAEDGKGGSF